MEEDTDQTLMERPHMRVHLGLVGHLDLPVPWVLKVTREPEENPAKTGPLVHQDREALLGHPDNQAKMVMMVVMVTPVPKDQLVLPVYLECLEYLDYQVTKDTGVFQGELEQKVTSEELEKGEPMDRLDLLDPQEISDQEVCLETEERRERKDRRVFVAEMGSRVLLVQSVRWDPLVHLDFLVCQELREIKVYRVRRERRVFRVQLVSMECLDHLENLEDRAPQELTEPRVREENGVNRERPVVLAFPDPLVSLD